MLTLVMLVAGCIDLDHETQRMNAQSMINVDHSSAPLLVPVDDRYRGSWEFHALDSPNNYTFRSNYSITPDPSVVRESLTIGHQINDQDSWTGGKLHGTDSLKNSLYVEAISDSVDLEATEECEWIDLDLSVGNCAYSLVPSTDLTEILIRRFEELDTVMLVAQIGEAALDFILGEFELVELDDAVERWLGDAR